MKPFQYHEPTTLKDACRIMAKYGVKANILAGGTDLVIKMKRNVLSPEHVVNIKKLRELNGITKTHGGFKIGTITPLADIADHTELKTRLPMVTEAARSVGSAQVRNIATIGGNICNAAPSADMAPGLLALNASVTLSGINGDRTIPLEEFFVGPEEVELKIGEILKEIFVPFPTDGMRMIYLKHGPRRTMDCAVVGVAVALTLENSNRFCQAAKIALGAVAPTPVRAKRTEQQLVGKLAEEFVVKDIKATVATEITPISDLRASAAYRTEMISTLTVRAIESLVNSK